jgi:GTP-binding protein
MYRAVAARALAEGTNPEDGAHLGRIASAIRFSLSQDSPPGLVLDGLPPERSLQASEVEQIVSEVARHPEVRSVMRREQRSLGRGGCVMEGRDIGTVVFPDADVKIFLSAEPGIRAGRRQRERGGDGVEAGVARRDSLDARTNPLVPAEDAHVLDTTKLTRDEMFEEALRIIHEAGGSRGRGAGG